MNIPLLLSFRGYKKKYLTSDLMAGLVVTAIAVPELMGIAALAGVPVQVGLYSALAAPLVFAVFGASRRLVVGADSATAVLLAGGAGVLAAAGSAQYLNIVLAVSLLSACLVALIGYFKFTFLADLISRPVMIGLMAGIGLQLMIVKLPELLGLHIGGTPAQVLAALPGQITSSNGMTFTVAVLALGLMIIFKRSRVPGALIAIAAAAGLAALFHAGDKGVAMVGALPAGLPHFSLPVLPIADMLSLLPIAFSVAVVILAQSAAVIRNSADEHDEKPDIPKDMKAMGLSGIASAITGGIAINASPPRTLVADFAGMKSQLASVVMSALVAILLLFAGSVFDYVPVAVLAAVVCMMGFHLIRFRELIYLAQHHKVECAIALLALFGVLTLGVFNGIILAVVASLAERLRREYHPSDDILLRDGRLSTWAEDRVGNLKTIPQNVLVYSFEESLFFENSQYFAHRLRKAIRSVKNPLAAVIIDAGAIDDIDYTAVEQLKQLYRQLSIDGVRLGFCHVSPNLLNQFENYGVIDLVGNAGIFPTLRAAVEYRPEQHGSVVERVQVLKLPKGDYVVVGGAVMEALNLRDSNDIDIVVSPGVYAKFAAKVHWREYVLSTGKVVLTHNGINLMRSWLGYNLAAIKRRDTFNKDSVEFMGVDQLISCKQHLGRRKDQSDITLLKGHKTRSRD